TFTHPSRKLSRILLRCSISCATMQLSPPPSSIGVDLGPDTQVSGPFFFPPRSRPDQATSLYDVSKSVGGVRRRTKEQLGFDQLDLHHGGLVVELDDIDPGVRGGCRNAGQGPGRQLMLRLGRIVCMDGATVHVLHPEITGRR